MFTRSAEVLTPAKFAANVDRELTRRSSSVLEQVQSMFTSASSACARGADPIAYYTYAVHRYLMILNGTVDLSEFRPADLAFTA